LQKQGVSFDVLVGLCVERSVEMIVGILAILKAGAAYLPLDPNYPQERLNFMLEDAQVSVLLTQQHLVERIGTQKLQVIGIDTDWNRITLESSEDPTSDVTIENLAYVIYTSGSTGKPKGVAIPHKAVNRLVCNTNYIKLDSSDKLPKSRILPSMLQPLRFGGALLHGAQLVGISRDVLLSPHDFALQLQEKGITVLFLTTALFQQIARDVPHALLRCDICYWR
jgi:non-ribosomal peptide synthetase component F